MDARKTARIIWDTLLKKQMIPEFHAIVDGLNYNIIDGKQRLTTIFKILNNEIPLLKKMASQDIKDYFFKDDKKVSVFFKDLEQDDKNTILRTSLRICEYCDIDYQSQIELFKKLNASMSLNTFSKGLVDNIAIRQLVTRPLLNSYPWIQNIFSEKQRNGSEDEEFIVRLMILMKNGLVSLEPSSMSKFYPQYSLNDLMKYKRDIEECFNKVMSSIGIKTLKENKKWRGILPVIVYYYFVNNCTKNDFDNICMKAEKISSLQGKDTLHGNAIIHYYNMIDNCVKK